MGGVYKLLYIVSLEMMLNEMNCIVVFAFPIRFRFPKVHGMGGGSATG